MEPAPHPPLSPLRRLLFLMAAAAALVAAVLVLASSGLPERAGFTGQRLPDGSYAAPEIGARAPLFIGQALKGPDINLLALRNGPVILNFWATWCEPCRVEMPELQMLYEELAPAGLRILAVNTGEPAAAAAAWATELGLSFDIIIDERQHISTLYRLRGMPTTFVIAPGGQIVRIDYGPTSASSLRQALAPYIEQDGV